jgi:hypothetical protein
MGLWIAIYAKMDTGDKVIERLQDDNPPRRLPLWQGAIRSDGAEGIEGDGVQLFHLPNERLPASYR